MAGPPITACNRGREIARRCVSKAIRACTSPRPTRIVLLLRTDIHECLPLSDLALFDHLATVRGPEDTWSEILVIENEAANALAAFTWPLPDKIAGHTLLNHLLPRAGPISPLRNWQATWLTQSRRDMPLPFCPLALQPQTPHWLNGNGGKEDDTILSAIDNAFNHDPLAGTLGVLPPGFAHFIACFRCRSPSPSSTVLNQVQDRLNKARLLLFDGAKAAWAHSVRLRATWWGHGMPLWVIYDEAAKIVARAHEKRAAVMPSCSLNFRLSAITKVTGLSIKRLLHKHPEAKKCLPLELKELVDENEIAKLVDDRPWAGRLRRNPPRIRSSLEDAFIDVIDYPACRQKLISPQKHTTMRKSPCAKRTLAKAFKMPREQCSSKKPKLHQKSATYTLSNKPRARVCRALGLSSAFIGPHSSAPMSLSRLS